MCPFNGSGTFQLDFNWPNDAANSVPITASRVQAEDQNIADGLSTCITRDGQSTTTAAIPFAQGIMGTATNDSAAAGVIGEFITSTLPLSSGSLLVSATPNNLTSIALTPGDWDVWGSVVINYSISGTVCFGGISTVSVTLPAAELRAILTEAAILSWSSPIVPQRFSVATNTTVFLIGQGTFGSGTATVGGIISARRAR